MKFTEGQLVYIVEPDFMKLLEDKAVDYRLLVRSAIRAGKICKLIRFKGDFMDRWAVNVGIVGKQDTVYVEESNIFAERTDAIAAVIKQLTVAKAQLGSRIAQIDDYIDWFQNESYLTLFKANEVPGVFTLDTEGQISYVESMKPGQTLSNSDIEVLANVVKQARRYMFIRDKEAFGCDNESRHSWDDLCDMDLGEFDDAIDQLIADQRDLQGADK